MGKKVVKTRYKNNELVREAFQGYMKLLTNKIFSILPMLEEESSTVEQYIESLNCEIMGAAKTFSEYSAELISVHNTLSSVNKELEHSKYRRVILHCCNVVSKLGQGEE